MKKIVSAALAGALLAGSAFAEFKVTGNARVYSDLFSYTSPTNEGQADDTNGNGTDDTGTVTAAKDTKHADDVTIQAAGEKSGIKIVFNVTSATQKYDTTATKTDVNLTSYQFWTDIFGVRLDAGAYDTRLAKNLNNDGNWGNNYSRTNKPGIYTNFDGAAWGKDAANITTIKGEKTRTNFQASKKINDNLTLRGVVFLSTDGTAINGSEDDKDEKWMFTPFAVGGTYTIDKDTVINFNAKLSSVTHGSKKTTAASSKWVKKTLYDNEDGNSTLVTGKTAATASYYDADGNELIDSDGKLTEAGVTYFGGGTAGETAGYTELNKDSTGTADVSVLIETDASTSYTPDNQVWTLNANIYKKLSSALEIEAGYTLGASLYTNWSGLGAYKDDRLVRDYDVFAHGIDFALKDAVSEKLSLTAVGGVNYIQSTAAVRATNRATSKDGYKDSLAKSYSTGAAGVMAYYATLSVDYKQSDNITFQVQTKAANSNLFATSTGDSSKEHVDYYKNFSLNVRPAILINPDKTSQFFAGVDFGFKGFQRNATGKNNTVQTTVTIPVGLRVKL